MKSTYPEHHSALPENQKRVKNYNICIIGKPLTGKTSIRKIIVGEPVDFENHDNRESIQHPVFHPDKEEEESVDVIFRDTTVTIKDVSSKTAIRDHCKGADGIFIVVDVSDPHTRTHELRTWRSDIKASIGNIPVILLANKNDVHTHNKILKFKLDRITPLYTDVMFVSAKNNQGITEAMAKMYQCLLTDTYEAKGLCCAII